MVVDMTYATQARVLFSEIEDARSRARFDDVEAAEKKIVEFIAKLETKCNELTERVRWQNECRIDAEIKASRLAEALTPYIEEAAPHEELFNGLDLRNFQRAEDAMAAFEGRA